ALGRPPDLLPEGPAAEPEHGCAATGLEDRRGSSVLRRGLRGARAAGPRLLRGTAGGRAGVGDDVRRGGGPGCGGPRAPAARPRVAAPVARRLSLRPRAVRPGAGGGGTRAAAAPGPPAGPAPSPPA